jgi:hypothetical protein
MRDGPGALNYLLATLLFASAGWRVAAQSDQAIYADALQNGWVAYGWATINYANTGPLHSGANSISVKINSTSSNWDAIYIHHDTFDSTPYTNVTFWINGGAGGGQQLRLQAVLSGTAQPGVLLSPLPANAWQQITVPLTALGVANRPDLTGLWIIDAIGAPQPIFYLDDIIWMTLLWWPAQRRP